MYYKIYNGYMNTLQYNKEEKTMKEQIKWDVSGQPTRIAVVELAGWRNKYGNATPMGQRIARTDWDNLTSAARNVLIHHGIIK
jgi:hypothetical protein